MLLFWILVLSITGHLAFLESEFIVTAYYWSFYPLAFSHLVSRVLPLWPEFSKGHAVLGAVSFLISPSPILGVLVGSSTFFIVHNRHEAATRGPPAYDSGACFP